LIHDQKCLVSAYKAGKQAKVLANKNVNIILFFYKAKHVYDLLMSEKNISLPLRNLHVSEQKLTEATDSAVNQTL
jgi:hypothetical protein